MSRVKSILLITGGVVFAGVAMLAGAGIGSALRPSKNSDAVAGSIELPQAEVIETEDGGIQVTNAPQVEAVDSQNASILTECGESEEECGLGTYYWAPIDTPYAFYEYTKDQCWNTDGAYGGQCWDFSDLFWQNYAGRHLSTCGTGAAKGTIQDGCWQINAGDDFEMVWDPHALQPGDHAVFGNGTFGHIGEVLGYYDNGYILLAGQNQGGTPCDGGGSSVNVIKISLKNFVGAFRPKIYVKETPSVDPVLPISGCVQWHVLRGDTMSKIMLECENTVVYGEAMDAYARTWYSLVYKPGQSVYDGWISESGVGLYAGDDIEHRTGE